MKLNLRSFVAVLVLLSFTVFGVSANGQEEKEDDGVLKIAYSSVGDPNPWFIAFAEEMEKEADARGYDFIVAHAQAKIEKQLADVEDLVAQQPDVLVLGPIDVEGSATCLEVAKQAGVPVIIVNRDILGKPGEDYLTRLYSDFEWLGAKQCETIYDAFGDDADINVVELHGTPGGGNTIGLSKGFRAQMEQYPNMKIVSSQLGDFNRATALKSMENIIQAKGGEFNAVFGHFDEEGIGAIQALKSAGYKAGDDWKNGEVVVVSNGGIVDALKAIKSGEMYATVSCSPYYADQVFDAAEAVIAGETLPDYIRVNDFVIDGTNIDDNMWFGF